MELIYDGMQEVHIPVHVSVTEDIGEFIYTLESLRKLNIKWR